MAEFTSAQQEVINQFGNNTSAAIDFITQFPDAKVVSNQIIPGLSITQTAGINDIPDDTIGAERVILSPQPVDDINSSVEGEEYEQGPAINFAPEPQPVYDRFGCTESEVWDETNLSCSEDLENFTYLGDGDSQTFDNGVLTTSKTNNPAPVKAVPDDDWRVRLSLAQGNKRLYQNPNIEEVGILQPLQSTNGIIFPYTPQIAIQYAANYENYDLTHSNYRGYFYKGSVVQNLLVTATFTAQDTQEANYMLASLHFLRSCTKMFYGQDAERGMPPPVVFLNGLGEYHFNDHPCVITMVNYNLPNDVDYIAAGNPDDTNLSQGFNVTRAAYTGHQSWSSKISRMFGAHLSPGAEQGSVKTSKASQLNQNTNEIKALTKIYKGKTYVPTKIDINFSMIPIQTRTQVSKEFSLRDYASGKLLKRGFW